MQKTIMASVMLLVVTVFSIETVEASPIIDSIDGKLNGYTNVLVDEAYYNVSFIKGPYNTTYNDNVFDNWPIARAAAIALLDQVFILEYDTSPALTRGITSTVAGTIFTPFLNPVYPYYYSTTNTNDSPSVGVPDNISGGYSGIDSYDHFAVWAVWEQAAAVPEPSTMLLLSSGLIGLVAYRKKRLP